MTSPRTLVDRLAHWAATTPDAPALNEKRAGRWQALSWSQYHQRVRALGAAVAPWVSAAPDEPQSDEPQPGGPQSDEPQSDGPQPDEPQPAADDDTTEDGVDQC